MSAHEWSVTNYPYPGDEATSAATCTKCGELMIPVTETRRPYDIAHRYRGRNDCKYPMNRRQAISHIWGLEYSVANEFYVGPDERDAGEKETAEALRALGVTDSELT